MEHGSTDEERSRRIWLLEHSYPKAWVDVLNEPLDPRHPTRHNIWTPVLDRLQERVYANGNRLRLDIKQCHISNAAKKQEPKSDPDWNWSGPSIPQRIAVLGSHLSKFKPPLVITFGADTFRFAQEALGLPTPPKVHLVAAGRGERFRLAVSQFDPSKVNVMPLLHAYVARSGWQTAGEAYSGNKDSNYFDYVGSQLGDILLDYGRKWSIWLK